MMNNNQNFCMGTFKFLNLFLEKVLLYSNSERMRTSRLEEDYFRGILIMDSHTYGAVLPFSQEKNSKIK